LAKKIIIIIIIIRKLITCTVSEYVTESEVRAYMRVYTVIIALLLVPGKVFAHILLGWLQTLHYADNPPLFTGTSLK